MAPKKPITKTPEQLAIELNKQIVLEQDLPLRESQLFKSLVKNFEAKQYKKGLKNVESILKFYPHNGETLCMKGMIEASMPNANKELCLQTIKEGLKYNMKSAVCWHVLGLYHKTEKAYHESIKAYNFAHKFDKENMQILRDLSSMQVQLRNEDNNLNGYIDTRIKLLLNRSGQRSNWLSLIIGHYLNNDYPKCLDTLIKYENMLDGSSPDAETGPYEHSEFQLFKNVVLEKSGDIHGAYKHTFEMEDKKVVTDHITLLERRANLAQQLNHVDIAEKCYRALLEINPDDHEYHAGLRSVLNLSSNSSENFAALDKLYSELAEQFPYSSAVTRLPLDYTSGSLFESKADAYIRKRLRKGIPSLFRDILPLYADTEKKQILTKLLKQYTDNISKLRFSEKEGENTESPSCFIWVYMYAAQHFDYVEHSTAEALKCIDKAIEHTPTALDLYCTKARIYKHAFDHQTAHKWFDYARNLDLADRYLNTKTVEYACRAELTTAAENVVGLFLRDNSAPIAGLGEMQACWFELGMADSFVRQNKVGRALKLYKNIEKHYDDFSEDLMDFHQYSMRKTQLRAYVNTLKWTENMRSHKFYFNALLGMAKCYLKLVPSKNGDNDSKEDGVSKEELKRQKLKAKKDAQKLAKATEAEDAVRAANDKEKNKGKTQEAPKKVEDSDPFGEKLVNVESPLTEADRYVKLLKVNCPTYIETHLLAVEVYLHKEKFLLALQGLKKAMQIDKNNAQIVPLLTSFVQAVLAKKDTFSPLISEVLLTAINEFIGQISILEYVSNYAKTNAQSPVCRLAAAKSLLLITPDSSTISSLLTSTDNLTASAALDCYKVLLSIKSDQAESYFVKCASLFPFARCFMRNNIGSLATAVEEVKLE